MDIDSMTLYLVKKHLGAIAIHAKINSVLGKETIGSSTVPRYLRKRSFGDSSEASPEEFEIEESDAIDKPNLHALDEKPFVSVQQLANRVLILITTARGYLVKKIGYKLKHFKWVHHKLSAAHKQTRVIASARLLDLLPSVQHQG
jgi:hypothetical protein